MIPAPTLPAQAAAPRPSDLQLRAGNGTRLTRNPSGQAVSMQGAAWYHPWFTKAYWWPSKKEWVAVVRPGFVNGRAPGVLTTADRMKSTPSFLAPITAWDGAADIAQAAQLAAETDVVDGQTKIYVPLYRNPLLSLSWKELGLDTAMPVYFTRRGVAENRRRVVSCDIVLHQPRVALTSQIDFPVDLVTGKSIVTQTLSLREPIPNDQLKLISMPDFDYVQEQRNFTNGGGLLQDYEEATWDEILVARIYLVSPTDATGEPDGSWIPAVKHNLFWNLTWAQPRLEPLPSDPSLPWIPPLAAGAGQLVINSLIASINDMTNQALNIVTAHSMAGTFWTPTGGGSDSRFPDPPDDTTDTFGFDKSARSKAKRAAAIKSGALIDRLDPPFPYNCQPFPLTLLN